MSKVNIFSRFSIELDNLLLLNQFLERLATICFLIGSKSIQMSKQIVIHLTVNQNHETFQFLE